MKQEILDDEPVVFDGQLFPLDNCWESDNMMDEYVWAHSYEAILAKEKDP